MFSVCGRWTTFLFYAGLFLFGQVALGYPDDWYEDTALTKGSCTAHPTTVVPRAPHGSPTQDSSIAFALSDASGAPKSDALCPGSTYTVTLTFGGDTRLALLTAGPSGVTFTSPSPTSGCPNRVDLGRSSWRNAKSSYTSTFKLSCDAAGGGGVTLMATTASKSALGWKQNSITVPVASAAAPFSCAAALAACASGAADTATPPPPPSNSTQTDDDDDDREDDDDDDDEEDQQLAASAGGGCGPSNLDYDCMTTMGKVTVHWSVNTTTAPDNYCTPDVPTVLQSSDVEKYGTLHMAVQASVTGYVSIGFGKKTNKMYPADIVLGWASSGDPNQYIRTFHVTSSDLDEGDLVTSGWAYDQGVVHNAADGLTTICFSRRLVDSRATASPDLTAYLGSTSQASSGAAGRRRRLSAAASGPELPLIWAVSSKQELVQHKGSDVGGGYLGSASEEEGGGEYWIDVHGALMAVAWGLLLPLGTLLPAHRWLLGDAKVKVPGWGEKHWWFLIHMVCQWSGMVLFIAGFIVAFVKLEAGDDLVKSHRDIGIAIMAAAGTQVLVAYVRPAPDSPRRGIWNLVHHNLGRATVLLAWANVYIGIVVYHQDDGAEYKEWITPIAIVMGLLAIIDLALRIFRPAKETSQGAVAARDPNTELTKQTADPYGGPRSGAAGGGAANGERAAIMTA